MDNSKTDDRLTPFDYLGIILKWRKFIIFIAFAAALLTLLFGWKRGLFYTAEIKVWASDPPFSLELLKSRDFLDRANFGLDSNVPYRLKRGVEGNAITIRVETKDSKTAEGVSKNLALGLLEKHRQLEESSFMEYKKDLEEQIQFFLEKQKQGLFLESIPLSSIRKSVPTVYVIDEEPTLLRRVRFFDAARNFFFSLLLGFFLSSLAVFSLEYAGRHRPDWEEMKRKYLV